MSKKILRYVSTVILFLAFAQTSLAFENEDLDESNDLYTIELIVFKFNQLEDSNKDLWKPTTPLALNDALEINIKEKIEFINDELPPPARLIHPLLRSEFVLNREESRIANNSRYTLLMHTGWKQNLSDSHSSKSIRIHGGGIFDFHGDDYDEVDGTLTISKGKFINIKTNLYLTEPAYEIAQIPNGLLSYPMHNSRRTKEEELNYIDNPVFGMLIKVTPPQST